TEPLHTMTSRMVERPQGLDTIIAFGSHADIISNLAVALARGHELLPRVDLDPSRRSPSIFRPAHGPPVALAGTGAANPIAALWSGALMLEQLGERGAAVRLLAAIEQVTASGRPLTPDLGGTATTREVADAVLGAVQAAAK